MTNLKRIREFKGLSQSGLAKEADVPIRIIRHYEQKTRDINKAAAITLYQISKPLDCTMEELLELEDKEE